jgi:hypothetical protein
MRFALLIGLATWAFAPAAVAAPSKVACTGSSSMAGVGSSDGHHISDELGKALGADFTVENYAVAATTAIKAVSNAYASTPEYQQGLDSNPDIVLFWFGGNDSWADVWPDHGDEFKADYKSLVEAYQALPSHPKTFLIRLWVFQDGPAQLDVLDQEILPMIDEIGTETNSTVIDYRTFITPHPEWFDDGMHANDTGTVFIGQFLAEQITTALAAGNNGGAAGAAGAAGADGNGGNGGASGATSASGAGGTQAGGSTGLVAPPAGGDGDALPPATAGSAGASGAAGSASMNAAGTSGSGGTVPTGGSNPTPTVNEEGSGCGIMPMRSGSYWAFWLLAFPTLVRRRRIAT